MQRDGARGLSRLYGRHMNWQGPSRCGWTHYQNYIGEKIKFTNSPVEGRGAKTSELFPSRVWLSEKIINGEVK